MIKSQRSTFSDGQAITATTLSDNVMDNGAPGTPYRANGPLEQDLGKGTKIPVHFQVVQDFNNLTSLNVAFETGDTDALGEVLFSQDILVADLVAGKQLGVDIMPKGVKRYTGFRYTVTGSAPTEGTVDAFIALGIPTNS